MTKTKVDPFLETVLKQVDKNTLAIEKITTQLKTSKEIKIQTADMDILFKSPMISTEHQSRGELFQDEITRLIKRYNIKSLHVNYEN